MYDCYSDPSKKEFSARVVEAAGNSIAIEPNYFFPGGGGQASDRGEISCKGRKAKVIGVAEERGKLLLKLEGPVPAAGEPVDCRIDWARRYPMMKAHTAEHILFQALSRQFDKIYPEKVTLEPNSYSLFVRYPSPLDWDKVLAAEKLVNSIIREGRPVHEGLAAKDDLPDDVRVKLERIGEEAVRIIAVENFDKVACSGLHVGNTSEISQFCVSRITSDGPGVWKIDFLVGNEAADFLLESSKAALSSMQILGTGLDRLESTLVNSKEREAQALIVTKELAEMAIAGLKPEEKNGLNLYLRVFPAMEPKIVQEWASKLARNEKTVVIFAVKGVERAFLLFGKSKDISLDVRTIGAEAFKLMGGKGGGNEFFVSGSGDAEKLGEALKLIANAVEK